MGHQHNIFLTSTKSKFEQRTTLKQFSQRYKNNYLHSLEYSFSKYLPLKENSGNYQLRKCLDKIKIVQLRTVLTDVRTGLYVSLRKPKVLVSQILRHYLTKEGRVRKLFSRLIQIKEPCVRNFEDLTRLKILGFIQIDV